MATDSVLNFVNPPGTGPIIRNDQGAGTGADRDFVVFKKGGTETFSVDSGGLPDPGGGDAKRAVQVSYGDLPADADALTPALHKFSNAVTITNIYVAVNANTADGSTNKQGIVVKRSSDDAAVTADGITNTANPGLADETWLSLGSITNAALAAGEYLYATFAKTSSGLAMAGLTFQIEYTLL
jgi:hypothetical protein